jgi:type IV fimbrial biogenesis protein FimT
MKRREKGLTLIELMVTLAVAIVLLAIGIPAFNAVTARDISATTVNALVSALQVGRVEAITRGQNVTVCAGATGTACGASWANGWATRASDGTIIRSFGAPRSEVDVTISGGTSAVFASDGRASVPVTFTVKAYKTSGTPRVAANCVRVVDVLVTVTGQVRSDSTKSCP